jgi:hypothetical protein
VPITDRRDKVVTTLRYFRLAFISVLASSGAWTTALASVTEELNGCNG